MKTKEPLVWVDTDEMTETIPLQPPLKEGELGSFGKYRILKELGRGGMGTVYLGFDTKLERRVAIKMMQPSYTSNPIAKERFLREAQVAARIRSDFIVGIYEADEIQGIPFIALQFLLGYSLEEYIKKKGLPSIAQVLRIGRETALGLADAHAHNLIHRDIKPGNIWLEAPHGRVKILDFGLAKPLQERREKELTLSGVVIGTPTHMAPEQGRGERVDARADLFSLGCMLYQLCTGKSPFERPTVMATLMALSLEHPTPVRELNPNVPRELADLLVRLLSKKREHRPASAKVVAQELAAIEANPCGSADHPTPQLVYVPMAVSTDNAFSNLGSDDEFAPTYKEAAKVPSSRILGFCLAGLALTIIVGLVAFLSVSNSFRQDEAKRLVADTKPTKSQEVPEKKVNLMVEWKPDDPIWRDAFARLRPEQQIGLFTKELKRANPEFKGNIEFQETDRVISTLILKDADQATDLNPVRVFPKLEDFQWSSKEEAWLARGQLKDISCLAKLPLRSISITGGQVTKIPPLNWSTLEKISFAGGRIDDIDELREGKNLKSVNIWHLNCKDLQCFQGKKLHVLSFQAQHSIDISTLGDCQVEYLFAYHNVLNWSKLPSGTIRTLAYTVPSDDLMAYVRKNPDLQFAQTNRLSILEAYELKPKAVMAWNVLTDLNKRNANVVTLEEIRAGLTEETFQKSYRNGIARWQKLPSDGRPSGSQKCTAMNFAVVNYTQNDPERIVWANATLDCERAEEGVLVFELWHNFGVWWNGELLRDLETSANTNNIVMLPVKTKAGKNELTIKVHRPDNHSSDRLCAGLATGAQVTGFVKRYEKK
ncbi:MAG: protein kinase domain-containing protein [Fimbriiglobus sp.]